MITKDEALKLALDHAKRDERHMNHAETRYWCRMYRDIAEKAIEALNAPLAEQPAQQEPVAWLCMTDQYSKIVRFELETFGNVTPLYTSPPAQRKPLTDEICNAFLQGIRYAANKYEAVSDERFTGGDVSNFLLMEAEELDSSDIAKAIKTAHNIKEST